MQGYFAVATIILLVAMVGVRVSQMRRLGIKAVHVGKLDKTDFLIPPFPLFYFYMIFASVFDWPTVSRQEFFQSAIIAWGGVLFCLLGLILFAWSIQSFGRSFRVGIDVENPGSLVTDGAFAVSRNPIYVAFILIFSGQFLIFPNWILAVFLLVASWMIHRQILREEEYMKTHYGQEYAEYCQNVRRYL